MPYSSEELDRLIDHFAHPVEKKVSCQHAETISRRVVAEHKKQVQIVGKPMKDRFSEAGCIPVLVKLIRDNATAQIFLPDHKTEGYAKLTIRGSACRPVVFKLTEDLIKIDMEFAEKFVQAGIIDAITLTYEEKRINRTSYVTRVLWLITKNSESGREKILTADGLKYIHEFLQEKPKDGEENKMDEALAFVAVAAGTSVEARRRLAQAGTITYLAKAAKLIIGQMSGIRGWLSRKKHEEDEGTGTLAKYLRQIFLYIGQILEENLRYSEEAEKEDMPDMLIKVIPDASRYCRFGSFRPCALQLMFFLWDSESMQKNRKKKSFKDTAEAIKEFHKKCEKVGYDHYEEGVRCKPYITRLVGLLD